MEIKTCRRCRRLFNYVVGQPICPACRDELEQIFQTVKKYIADNRNSSINDVADACDVDPQQIRQWIREERLQFSEDSAIGLNCESCGAMVRSGRFCDKCKVQMTNNLNKAFGINPGAAKPSQPAASSKGSPKMRYLDN